MTTLLSFETARAMIGTVGLTLGQCHYSPQDFGSWFVVADTAPRRRLVWDGRESQLVVEIEEGSGDAWSEVWIRSTPTERDVSEGIAFLCKGTT